MQFLRQQHVDASKETTCLLLVLPFLLLDVVVFDVVDVVVDVADVVVRLLVCSKGSKCL